MRLANRVPRPRLAVESLERRDNPAGTVTATLSGTTLTLTGDDADNDIVIRQTGPTAFTVLGNDTTIAGGLTFPAFNLTALKVVMKDGNDAVAIDAAAPFTLSGLASFDLGDGDNQLSLVTDGRIDLGGLTVLAGDGQDHVTVAGGAGTNSRVAGNVVVSLGIGRGPQQPNDLDTHADFARLAVHGPGGVKYTAADGNDVLTFDTVTVDRALSAAGAAGSLVVTATDSRFGSVLLNGTASPSSGDATSLIATRVTVAGPTTLKTAANIFGNLTDVTTGPLAVQNRAGFTDVELAGGVTVNGNVTFTGFRHTLELSGVPNPNPSPDDMGLPSVLTVTGDINMTGTSAVDVRNYGSVIKARNVTLGGPDPSYTQDYDLDYGDSRFDLTGNLTMRGGNVSAYSDDGDLHVAGNVLLAGGYFSAFDHFHTVTGFQTRATIGGSLTLTASTGEAKLQADGTSLTVGGNLSLSGAGWTDLDVVTDEPSTVGGTVTQRGGPESDSFRVDGNFQSNGLSLTFKDGHNFVQLGAPDLPAPAAPRPTTINGNVKVTTGPGSDWVQVTNARVTGTTTLSLGAGADEVHFRTGATFDGAVTIDLGAGADRLTAGLALSDPYDPLAPPVIPAGTVTLNAAATVHFGTGNDRMQLGVAGDPDGKVVFGATGSLTADGDGNLNTFDPQAGQFDPAKVTALHFTDPTP